MSMRKMIPETGNSSGDLENLGSVDDAASKELDSAVGDDVCEIGNL